MDQKRHVPLLLCPLSFTRNHHNMQDSSSPRSGHIPGYGGFIPTNRAESLHAATYTNMTKSALNGPGINVNPGQLSSTGRNLNPQALIDVSKNASSHKYGKTEIQTPHPAWVVLFHLFSRNSGAALPRPPTSVLIYTLSLPTETLIRICRLAR